MLPEKKKLNTTEKRISSHVSNSSYRNIELRHSSHQIHYLALTQERVNQLSGSSDVNNRAFSVGSSVSDKCRKFIHQSQIDEGQDMMLSKAKAKIELF